MELKDKIKQLRKEKGLTQAQLADALFVSRSTVAKWENGLGLPGPDSMKALEALFAVEPQQIATTEPETVIVEKNRKLHLIGQIVGWVAMIALLTIGTYLPIAIHNGDYGFTPEMVAQGFADREYIDTGDYRFYYFIFEGNDLANGHYWTDLQAWVPVQKHIWGCTIADMDDAYRIVTKDNYVVARLYSFKGKNGYYNILHKCKNYKVEKPGDPLLWDIPVEMIGATSITINGMEYQLEDGFFFITQEPVEYFKISESWYNVE